MTTTPLGSDLGAPVPSDSSDPSAPPRGRRRLVTILVVATGLVAGTVGVVSALTTGSSSKSGPEAAVQEYLDSYLAGDCAGVDAVTTDDFFAADDAACTMLESDAGRLTDLGADLTVGDVVTVSGTAAEVETVTLSTTSDSTTQWYSVIKVDGSWQIDKPVFHDAG